MHARNRRDPKMIRYAAHQIWRDPVAHNHHRVPRPGAQDTHRAQRRAAINAAEMLYGVARLPEGRRKAQLDAAVKALVREAFQGRVAAFDASGAGHYAAVASERDRRGHPIAAADAQIAAICRARGAALATRNTKDFEGTRITLINPWHEQ